MAGPSKTKASKTRPEARTDTNVRFSHVSGGGGERDSHHGHAAKAKRDTEENRIQKSLPGD